MAEFATVARPYAKALYGLAKEQDKLQAWLKELALMAEVVNEPKVQAALSQPELRAEEQSTILLSVLDSENLDVYLKRFITVLAENKRLSALSAVYDLYRDMALSEEKIQQASIFSAFPIQDDTLKEIIQSLESKLKSKLEVQVFVQPELIGGIKVEFGDQVLDMSVKSKLNALYSTMIN